MKVILYFILIFLIFLLIVKTNNLSHLCLFIIIFVALTVFICISKKRIENFKDENIKGKTIWILSLNGWKNMDWCRKKVVESWKKLNSEWDVILLDENNYKKYVNVECLNDSKKKISNQSKENIIKLNILAKHGGIWADNNVLCMMPVDNWIYEALEPTGFWMYHQDNFGSGIAPWFIVTIRQSYIIELWKKSCDSYWNINDIVFNENWVNDIFYNLCKFDPKFSLIWKETPYLWSNEKGQANMLMNRLDDNDDEIKKIIKKNPPYVLNNVRGGNELIRNSNLWAAFDESIGQINYPYPLHKLHFTHSPIKFSDRVYVASDCGHDDGVKIMQKICSKNNVEMVIYDKCNFCKHIPNGIYCRPLKNTGREQATYLHFVIKHYDNLPNNIFFVPSNTKHDRPLRLKNMIANEGLHCGNGKKCTFGGDFSLNEWEGKKVDPAYVRPYKNWFEYYIDNYDKLELPCWNGIMRTSKERILRNPIYKYINLYKTLIETNNPESGHFMERSMANVF